MCACVCVCVRTVKTTCWWVALYLGFQVYALTYQLNLSSFLFQITTHAHEQIYSLVYVCVYVCMCVCVCVCVCVCGWVGGRVCGGGTRLLPSRIYCCSPLWPKVNGWRISPVFSPSIVWGSSGSVLDSDGSSVRGALNHSKTPHNNISIVYLFSLFSPRLVGGEKRKSKRAEDSFSQDLNCWRNCLWSPLVSGIS